MTLYREKYVPFKEKFVVPLFYRNFVGLVLHPRSNGTVKSDVMDCVRLRVQTVPTSDPETHEMHTAYTVLWQEDATGELLYASGWTLRDAIGFFCQWFRTDRCQIKLIRPFRPQRVAGNDYQ